MPRNKTRSASAAETATVVPSIADVRQIADALCRAAHACHQQHGRSARLATQGPIELEERFAEQLCSVCDESLGKLASAYERAAAHVRPAKGDEDWWHRANALWLASTEYMHLHKGRGGHTRRPAAHHHGASELEALHIEYELDASALLALRHACEDYRRARPEVL